MGSETSNTCESLSKSLLLPLYSFASVQYPSPPCTNPTSNQHHTLLTSNVNHVHNDTRRPTVINDENIHLSNNTSFTSNNQTNRLTFYSVCFHILLAMCISTNIHRQTPSSQILLPTPQTTFNSRSINRSAASNTLRRSSRLSNRPSTHVAPTSSSTRREAPSSSRGDASRNSRRSASQQQRRRNERQHHLPANRRTPLQSVPPLSSRSLNTAASAPSKLISLL